MTDAAFLAAPEDATLPESAFGHAGHVRAAYLYLRRASFGRAIEQVSAVLKRYAAARGKPERYHETMTVAFLALINERLFSAGDAGGWADFASRHPDLLDKAIIGRFYLPETLQTERARRVFVLAGDREERRTASARP